MISYPRTFVREREYEHSHGGDSVSSTDFLSMLADTPAWSTVHLCGLSGSNTSVLPPKAIQAQSGGKEPRCPTDASGQRQDPLGMAGVRLDVPRTVTSSGAWVCPGLA